VGIGEKVFVSVARDPENIFMLPLRVKDGRGAGVAARARGNTATRGTGRAVSLAIESAVRAGVEGWNGG
jgi:hypothetical protein